MRIFAKKLALGLWVLLGVIIGTVFRQNIEQEATRQGFDSLISQGFGVVTASGYEVALLWAFAILTGILIAIYGEVALRKWETSKKIENWQHFTVDWKDGQPIINKLHGVDAITILDGTVMGSIYDSDPKITRNAIAIIVQFDCEIIDPCPYVFADRKIIWREVKGGKHYLLLEFDLRAKEDVAFGVAIRPLAWSGGFRSEFPMRWHDASQITREQVLDDSTPERPTPRWLPGIAARTLRKIRPG